MTDHDWLAEHFETNRPHLRAVAFRMLGSLTEADDAVQEAWFRLSRADAQVIDNLGGWLTTVVARICLDLLRTRSSRRETPLEPLGADPIVSHQKGTDPEQEALLADSVGLALLVVLGALPPAERVAFVLHDVFAVPFDEIAPVVGRSPTAARQLASRARRRVRGPVAVPDAERSRHREVVDAFLAAARGGDFAALLEVLDPEIVVRADPTAVRAGGSSEVRGATAAAAQFSGRALAARTALVNGAVGIVVAPRGRLRLAMTVTVTGGKITAIDVIADPDRLRHLDLAVFDVAPTPRREPAQP